MYFEIKLQESTAIIVVAQPLVHLKFLLHLTCALFRLILSEDEFFNGYVHDNVVKDVDWYGERVLGEISLGGLIILVVIRTIQHNMLKVCKFCLEFANNAMFSKLAFKIS